ncbi:hypothetical protein N7486_002951 [Penicillium sp. IBT 16267x]|nr:hypothetical protein N7486_002951 [Penicillium sp. IBT 16267x]
MVRLIPDGEGSVLTSISNRVDQNALHEAAQGGHHEVCELLLEHGRHEKFKFMECLVGCETSVYLKYVSQHTPFVYPVKGGHTKAVEVFLRNKPIAPKARNGYKELLFHKPVLCKNCEMVKVFLGPRG